MFSDFDITQIFIVVISLLISVGIHEAIHAFVAHRLGDDTAAEEGRLTLNPLKHVDIYTTVLLPTALLLIGLPPIFIAKPVPFDPERVRYGEYGSALVALAGPFSNLVLASITALAIRIGIIPLDFTPALVFLWINVALFVFNMIPIPPLDGSRLLYAFAPEPLQRLMYRIESMGIFAIVFIVLILMAFGFGAILVNINRGLSDFLLPGVFV